MAIYKDEERGTWYFHREYRDKKGNIKQIKRRGFKRKKDAQIAERNVIDKFKKPNANLLFEELAKHYMDYAIGRKKERTIENQNNLINTVLMPSFGKMKITKIKPTDIDLFYREILPKYTNATMKNIRTALSAIMNHAVLFYDLPKNVVNIVKLPKKDQDKTIKYWTLDQFNEFIEHVDNPVYKTMFSMLFWTGLRKGEMLALRVCDVDLQNKSVSVQRSWNGKQITSVKNTSSERNIGIPQHLCDEVAELIEYHRDKHKFVKLEDYLFATKTPIRPMAPSNVNLQLKKAMQKTNLPQIRVHYFRHSHATLLINKGVSLYVVSKHLGHDNIQTTANIYGHLYPNSEKEVSDLLESAYNKNLD